jgi:hypothetical protein
MKRVMCIEKLTIRNFTFREGEEYIGNIVNDNYWIVETVGIPTDEFTLHFEVIEELEYDKVSGNTIETNNKFIEEEREFREFLNDFGGFNDKEENKKKYKISLIDKIKNYIFV